MDDYFQKTTHCAEHRVVKDNGDYYLSISGSDTDGFQIMYYRKLGWDSVTSLNKVDVVANISELTDLLSNIGRYRP